MRIMLLSLDYSYTKIFKGKIISFKRFPTLIWNIKYISYILYNNIFEHKAIQTYIITKAPKNKCFLLDFHIEQ